LKILFIHNRYQLQGGEDTAVEQEMKLLSQYHELEVLYFQNQSGWKGAIQFLVSIWNINAAKKVSKKIIEFKPDIVHIHNWHFASGPLVFRTIHNLKIPIVHTIHNYRLLCPSGTLLNKGKLFKDSLKQSFPWASVKNKVYRSSYILTFWLAFVVWFHKKTDTWKMIDCYVCLTSSAVTLFQQSNFGISEKRYTVKPNFTTIPLIKESSERGAHFLFIGRLSEEKGITLLLKVFKDLPYDIRIAGEGPMKKQVVNASRQSENIFYLGNLTRYELESELQKTQALIFPSIWHEPFGLVNIEAFASSTPVLASNIGAPTSLIIEGYNGFLFEPGNETALKETIIKFDNLSKLDKDQIGKNAFEQYKSKYSPDLQLDYLNSIYNSAIKNRVHLAVNI
jgi:glycosyltransferase involved in cell wall biosynthesis